MQDDDFLDSGERAFFESLNQLGVRYLVVGMSAAVLQGANASTEDIDLWFEDIADDRIGEAARRAGGFWITRMQPPTLGGLGGDAMGDRLDVVSSMSGLPQFGPEYAQAVPITLSGVPLRLLPLPRILLSKRAAGRAKDKSTVHLLEMALRVMEEAARDEEG